MRAAFFLVAVQCIFSSIALFLAQGIVAVVISMLFATLFICAFLYFVYFEIYDSSARGYAAVFFYTIASIISIIVMFANSFRWNGIIISGAEKVNDSFWDCMYLSIITWTTVGYGDIVPAASSRPIAALEAFVGYVVMALVISMIISIIQTEQNQNNNDILSRLEKQISGQNDEQK